ncbi:hypothetical protein P7C73_g6778, partial [Tremellales sp. Uapishka_1]
MAALPHPRRVITVHAPDGALDIKDETLVPFAMPTYSATPLYHQADFLSTTQAAVDGANDTPQALSVPGGILTRFLGGLQRWKTIGEGLMREMNLDIPPTTETPVHFTDTIDILVVIQGQVELHFHDGTKTDLKQGEFLAQLGNVHQFINTTDQWCRLFGVVVPLKEAVLVDGKPLDEKFGVLKM